MNATIAENLTAYVNINDNETFAAIQEDCGYFPKVTPTRFILISISAIVAVFGIVCNSILIYTFLTRGERKQLLLGCLAIFDWFICVSFIALFFNDTLVHYYQIKFAYDILYDYVIVILCFSKVAQLAIPLLLIAISLEKWAVLISQKDKSWR